MNRIDQTSEAGLISFVADVPFGAYSCFLFTGEQLIRHTALYADREHRDWLLKPRSVAAAHAGSQSLQDTGSLVTKSDPANGLDPSTVDNANSERYKVCEHNDTPKGLSP